MARELAQTSVIYVAIIYVTILSKETSFVVKYWIYQTQQVIKNNVTTFNFIKRASFLVESVIYRKYSRLWSIDTSIPMPFCVPIGHVTTSKHWQGNRIDVMKNLNLVINHGEKIGIVGRTGAGK